jgi:hypothetical protein
LAREVPIEGGRMREREEEEGSVESSRSTESAVPHHVSTAHQERDREKNKQSPLAALSKATLATSPSPNSNAARPRTYSTPAVLGHNSTN